MCLNIAVIDPSRVESTGSHLGFQWHVTYNRIDVFRFRCGYVRVPAGHPWHGMSYFDVGADVHGGLTFGEPDVPCDKGDADDGYWFGFDCGHYGDHNLSQDYVEDECKKLCSQAAEAAK